MENCEVEKDISSFIQDRGTGQEIPDPPKYINFCRGDIDSASEASDDEAYSVAQFQRTINPAYRSSSPVPSTYESHHDPNSDLAKRMSAHEEQNTPRSRENTITPQKGNGQLPPQQPDFRRQAAQVQAAFQQNAPELAPVPHNEYPADGMTMFCRTDGQSERSSVASPMRPASRDSQSEYSNPTSFSSVEPPSPIKQNAPPTSQPVSPNKAIQKKRSGFFSNSPFRRKSKHEKERPQSMIASHNTWDPSNNKNSSSSRQGVAARDFANGNDDLEPVDPRANFQLNVGQNVFDVASPDTQRKPQQSPRKGQQSYDEEDPLVAALAELKGVGKQSASRVSADRYHGISTPAPGSQMQNASTSGQRGTPPPSYNDPGMVKRLDAPRPAHTSAQMQAATRKYAGQNADIYGPPSSSSRPGTSSGPPRASSPLPLRSASPRPGLQQDAYRATSPNPYVSNSASQNHRPRQSQSMSPQKTNGYGSYCRHESPNDMRRAASPQPQFARNERPASAQGQMQLQLSQGDGGALGQGGRGGAGSRAGRPMTYYGGGGVSGNGGGGMEDGRGGPRSKSLAPLQHQPPAPAPQQQQQQEKQILHYGKPYTPLTPT